MQGATKNGTKRAASFQLLAAGETLDLVI